MSRIASTTVNIFYTRIPSCGSDILAPFAFRERADANCNRRSPMPTVPSAPGDSPAAADILATRMEA